MENKKHAGNYTGTTNTNAQNQDLAFVNDTLENAPNTNSVNIAKDDISEENEQIQLNQK
ncbi:hypothetical protein GCM10008018_61870 [Paenibacillus marchantiophytorum]|uniref:DUF4025 domain-containing protein n=1 Tax=Paenibacillus marchantiophytorum TaxID=1619310 RepID=A0ABQ1FE95_9BACL|nr:hypothetical protein [Paenibacillus marchantiophytorum]GGA07819.1 hypothetical protein GCM10008018_61870 [Paenibacillus marchantiophytorum]